MSNESTKKQVLEVLKKNILDVMGEIDLEGIAPEVSLKDLGANSLDRSEIAVACMEELGLAFPARELAGVKNIGGLIDLFTAKLS